MKLKYQPSSSKQAYRDWQSLASRFCALQPKKGNGLTAAYEGDNKSRKPAWFLIDVPSEDNRIAFLNAAKQGAWMAGRPATLAAWLKLLKGKAGAFQSSIAAKIWGGSDGVILRVCEKSADYCLECASKVNHAKDKTAKEVPPNEFRRVKENWRIVWNGQQIGIRDYQGLHFIAYLLKNPNREIAAAELRATVSDPVPEKNVDPVSRASMGLLTGISGEVRLRKQDREKFTTAIEDLEWKKKEAQKKEEKEAIQEKIVHIKAYISKGKNIYGKSRPTNDPKKTARVAISQNLSTVYAALKKTDTGIELAKYLKNHELYSKLLTRG